MKAATEQHLVNACLQLLRLPGVPCWRQTHGALTGIRGDKRLFVRFSTMLGVSDILGVLTDGRFLACECKRPGNKPSPEQAAFLSAVDAASGLALVVHDVRELEKALEREHQR